jgi:hypothetical protein
MNDLSRKKRHLPFEKFYAIFLISSIFVPISYLFSVSFIIAPGFSGVIGVFIQKPIEDGLFSGILLEGEN